MKIIELENDFIDKDNNYIALGNFDGLHRAHIEIIENLVKKSKNDKMCSSILLFKNHSLASLKNSKHKVLSSLNQKLNILEKKNIDKVFIVDFDSIKNIEPEKFIEDFLIKKLNIKGIFIGFDYRYGKGAKGDTKLLKKVSNERNIFLNIEQPIKSNNEIVSSTSIKTSIRNNNLLEAENLLGRKYFIEGIIIRGKQLGTKLGFPTANIEMLYNYTLPSEGVYYSEIIVDNKSYKAATSLGKNYTFNENEFKLEAHILDFNDNIYGKNVQIRFIEKIRDMEKFNNLDELITQVNLDIDNIKSRGFNS